MDDTPQAPLPSGFGFSSTARDVLGGRSLVGKDVVVTGGYAGIGLETTRVLAEAGATVIVPVRSPAKASAALAGIDRVELLPMDLADPASIDALAARMVERGRPIHLLVNNAGIMAAPLSRDARGFESQFAVNHLGHFQLTVRLWRTLADGARVISLSSRGHQRSAVDLDDPWFERRPYDKWAAYGQAKTANVLFAVGLDARGRARGIRAFAVHPGGIVTDLMRHLSEEERRAFGVVDGKLTVAEAPSISSGLTMRFKTVEQGAATQVWAATSPQLEGKGGVYCEDCDVAVVVQEPSNHGVRPYAIDRGLAEALWARSEAWTGVTLEG
ncbi:MAG: SDR family NAD(P)-dependent oxidoreductase [Myxococcales bacterium]|nr:SDR family NAD(P)-dependent oxidoreductase [Myxococcales bacterium]